MFKKSLVLSSILFASTVFASTVSKEDCEKKGEGFIYAQSECINYKMFSGDGDALNIVIPGTWDEGSDTLARYAPYAEDVTMRSDVSTIAVALPGYSKSSSNNLVSIGSKTKKNQAAKKEYVEFLGSLVEALKEKHNASKVTIIAHSAGCMMSATLLGTKPGLVDNLVCAGGIYDIHKNNPDDKTLISAVDVIDNINKDTKIIVVYGTQDDVSTPQMNIDFYNLAKTKGLDVKLVEAKGAPHMELEMTSEALAAIVELVEE